MSLVLSEEHQILQQSAAEFFSTASPITAFRNLRQTDTAYDPEVWRQMVELGWSAVLVPEALDGLDFGLTGMGVLAIEAARSLVMSPLTSSAAVGVTALKSCQPNDHRDELLKAVGEGKKSVAFAHLETAGYRPDILRTQSASSSAGFTLNGVKPVVANAHSADIILLTSRSATAGYGDSDPYLCVLEKGVKGLTLNPVGLMDEHQYANVECVDLSLAADKRLEWAGDAQATLISVLDVATVMAACELYGCSLVAFEQTISYLEDREQFGRKIGSFQALQHRMAHAYTQLELLKSVVFDALGALEAGRKDASIAVSHAKALANDTAKLITTEAIQMHGGIGITDELDIGLFYKRARVLRTLWGDSAWHRARFASLNGY